MSVYFMLLIFTLPAFLFLCCYRYLERKYDTVCDFYKKHKTTLWYIIWGILILGK